MPETSNLATFQARINRSFDIAQARMTGKAINKLLATKTDVYQIVYQIAERR
jgi:hypothetical protein